MSRYRKGGWRCWTGSCLAGKGYFTILLYNKCSNSGLLISSFDYLFFSCCYRSSDCRWRCWWCYSYYYWGHLLFYLFFDNCRLRSSNFHLRRFSGFFGHFCRRGWDCYERFKLICGHAYRTGCRDIRRRSRCCGNHCRQRQFPWQFLIIENKPICIGNVMRST